jgi:hypothetical protein
VRAEVHRPEAQPAHPNPEPAQVRVVHATIPAD